MSDLYELQLVWELGDTVPSDVLDELRWHLGLPQDTEALTGRDGNIDQEPLLDGKGPARRIDGTLSGELVRGRHGWSLTARQERHAEELPELCALLNRLAAVSHGTGPVGQLRHYEDDIPDLLVNDSGAVVRRLLRPDDSGCVPFLTGLA
ncbi:hypothetical protein [Streptomyces syringium]|uniref:hypothetical protein n=1 Tax=Streptomyces syringium TaxID=76729 RepID=UPI0034566263